MRRHACLGAAVVLINAISTYIAAMIRESGLTDALQTSNPSAASRILLSRTVEAP
jgi:hypothetical protein